MGSIATVTRQPDCLMLGACQVESNDGILSAEATSIVKVRPLLRVWQMREGTLDYNCIRPLVPLAMCSSRSPSRSRSSQLELIKVAEQVRRDLTSVSTHSATRSGAPVPEMTGRPHQS